MTARSLSGILFVLYTGIPWEFLPQELGSGSGMTRRLRRSAAKARAARRQARGAQPGGAGCEVQRATCPAPMNPRHCHPT